MFCFCHLVLICKQNQKLGKLAVVDQILITAASYHRAYGFVSGLLATKFVGQNFVIISDLATVSLYIQSLRSKATKESSFLMASPATTGQPGPLNS